MGGATRAFYLGVLRDSLRILALLLYATDAGIDVPDRAILGLVPAATGSDRHTAPSGEPR